MYRLINIGCKYFYNLLFDTPGDTHHTTSHTHAHTRTRTHAHHLGAGRGTALIREHMTE